MHGEHGDGERKLLADEECDKLPQLAVRTV